MNHQYKKKKVHNYLAYTVDMHDFIADRYVLDMLIKELYAIQNGTADA